MIDLGIFHDHLKVKHVGLFRGLRRHAMEFFVLSRNIFKRREEGGGKETN